MRMMRIWEPAVKCEPRKPIFQYLEFSLAWLVRSKIPFLAERIYEFSVNERILEYPFVHQSLELQRGGRVLDVGCGGSRLPVELASLGSQVWAIDLGRYFLPIRHPNFTFVQGDIRKAPFDDNFFDRVIAVSTIEHIGMGGENDLCGDKKALQEMARITKVGGKIIITVPFGKGAISYFRGMPWYRVYDMSLLKELLSGLHIEKIECALKKEGNWLPVSPDEAENIDSSAEGKRYDVKAVAMLIASKQHNQIRLSK